MDRESQSARLRSFVIGGVVGASAALAAAARRRRRSQRPVQPGLAAFEDAPCYRETLVRESGRSQSPNYP